MSIPYTITDTSITAVLNFSPKIIPSSHPNFIKIREVLTSGEADPVEVENLLDLPKAITATTGGDVTIEGGQVFYKGFAVKNSLASMILKFMSEGSEKAAEPLKKFLANAFENPDRRASDDLYDWCVASNLPITEDGYILAWKAVSENYRSLHRPNDPRFDHHVGNTVTERRQDCDANPDNTCSRGLHFCSAPYLKNYASGGARVVALKINPRDVVAFPRDYGWEKGRACEYQVVGEVPFEEAQQYYPLQTRIYTGWDADPRLAQIAAAAGPQTGSALPQRDSKGRFVKRSA